MKRLIEFPLEEGSSIFVEVDELEPEGGFAPCSPDELLQRSKLKFEQALGMMKPVAENIIKTLSTLDPCPEQITAELAFKFSAGGVLIASLGAEANCKVTLTWKQ